MDGTVATIMDRKLVSVAPKTSVLAAMKLIQGSNVDLLLIVDAGKLVGIVEEPELKECIDNHACHGTNSVEHVAKRPIFVEQNSTFTEALKLVILSGVKRIAVVESKESMHCVGIVTSSELLKAGKK